LCVGRLLSDNRITTLAGVVMKDLTSLKYL
jgi:hypothetical protein